MQQEIWKEVPDYPRYEASNLGKVRSWQNTRWGKSKKARIINGVVKKYGHTRITLYKDKKDREFYLHTIILITFVGPRPEGLECCHNNGNASDSSLSNLRWDTHKSNVADMVNHGTQAKGANQGASKLKDGEVLLIKKLLNHNVKQNFITKMFKMSSTAINSIKMGKTWGHLVWTD